MTSKSRPIVRERQQQQQQIHTLHHPQQQQQRFSGLVDYQLEQQQPLNPLYHQYQQQQVQQHYSLGRQRHENEFFDQQHHYAVPNVDGFLVQQQPQQQQQQHRSSTRLSACLDFNTVNTRSSYVEEDADDEFVISMQRNISKL